MNSQPPKETDLVERGLPYKESSPWADVPLDEWRDWHWQMRNRITTVEDLKQIISQDKEEEKGVREGLRRFRFAIPPYYASLINRSDPDCPIRKQSIPGMEETIHDIYEVPDPLNEEGDLVAPGMTHRYPDRVLWVVMNQCGMFCRHCTRNRKVGDLEATLTDENLETGIAYLRDHPEVRDVLLSGGDPFLLSDERLDEILHRIRRGAPNVAIIRFGTRMPVSIPQRVTPGLIEVLKRHHPIYVNTHFNVPKEFTLESRLAVARLADAGIPLGNQTVLLAGVNDCWALMRGLMYECTANRVRPYYIYQCDLSEGMAHFRTPVSKGIEIVENLRGHISGLAVPTFVVDAPGGGGKIPVAPNYVVTQHEHKFVLRNFEGRIVSYEEPRSYVGMCTEGGPCEYCREVMNGGESPVGVAGLFDSQPDHISLVPMEHSTPSEECAPPSPVRDAATSAPSETEKAADKSPIPEEKEMQP